MRYSRLPLIALLLAAGLAGAQADAPLVHCYCSEGEFGCLSAFWYDVSAGSYPVVEFVVGTNDLDSSNYLYVATPSGWHFAIEPIGMSHACGLFALHGQLSQGPCYSLTAGRVRWWTDDPTCAIEFYTFGFQHNWRAEDVGWTLVTRRPGDPPEWNTFSEFWDSPVGLGEGPLHGPYAPPAPCSSNADCAPGDYCAKHRGDCDGDGFCLPRPIVCPPLWEPVCGCNGTTYSNACVAAVAGVNVDFSWACDAGDLDHDGDVDIHDFASYEGCVFGPDAGIPLPCADADLDFNLDVDCRDFQGFQVTYNTPPPQAPPQLVGYGDSGCLSYPLGRDACGEDEFVLTVAGGTLDILHRNAYYNCCPDDIVVTLDAQEPTLNLTETAIVTLPCWCMCCYDVWSSVTGLLPGSYTVSYCWFDEDSGVTECHTEVIAVP